MALTVANAYGQAAKSYARYVDVLGDLPKDYCYSAAGNPSFSYISRVSVGPLDHRSGSDSYSLRDEPIQVAAGSTQTLLVEANVVTPVNNDRNFLRAWVDWNGDLLFDDGEQVMDRTIFIADQPVEVTQTFIVPDGAAGTRRLRVKLNYDEGPLLDFGACQGFESGEVEDYVIEVTEPTASGRGAWQIAASHSRREQRRLDAAPVMVRLQAELDSSCAGLRVGETETGPALPSREQTLAPGGDRLLLNLRAMFPSELEDPAAYSAQSDNDALATVEIADGQLRVRSNQAGDTGAANIVVTAIFGDGRRATFSFVLTIGAEARSFLKGWRLGLLEDAGRSAQ